MSNDDFKRDLEDYRAEHHYNYDFIDGADWAHKRAKAEIAELKLELHHWRNDSVEIERDSLREQLEELKSYMPKVPTHAYEKEMAKEIVNLRAQLEAALDENKSLKFNLEQKAGEIGRAEHRGNTVDYIYDKAHIYGEQIQQLTADLAICREALEHYANNKNYNTVTGAVTAMRPRGISSPQKLWSILDFGDTAQEALAKTSSTGEK